MTISATVNGIKFVQNTRSFERRGTDKFGIDIELNEALKEQYPEVHEVGTRQDTKRSSHIVRGKTGDFGNGYLSADEMRPVLTQLLFDGKARHDYPKLIEAGRQALLPKIEKAKRADAMEYARAKTVTLLMKAKNALTRSSFGEPGPYLTDMETKSFNAACQGAFDHMSIQDPAVLPALRVFGALSAEEAATRKTLVACIDRVCDFIHDAPFERNTGKDVAYGVALKVPGE